MISESKKILIYGESVIAQAVFQWEVAAKQCETKHNQAFHQNMDGLMQQLELNQELNSKQAPTPSFT